MSRKKTVLVVVAHADDMEFLAGGTVARFVDEKGYDVYEYILTDNSKGSYRLSAEELVAESAKEAVVAGEVLGLKEVRLEKYVDAFLNETPHNTLREMIMAMIREVKADVVLSWDPFAPCEDHPDHRAVAMATYEAASFAGNPMFHPEHAHPPHTCTEAYWIAKQPMNADKFVDITNTIEKKIEALLKHDTQMALTVDAMVAEAKAIGVDVPGMEGLDKDGYQPIIAQAIRDYCAEVGQKVGVQYAEQFRYERFGMLDRVLGPGVYEPDF